MWSRVQWRFVVPVQCFTALGESGAADLDPLDPQFLSQVFDPAETAVRGGDAARQLLHSSTMPPAVSQSLPSSADRLTGKIHAVIVCQCRPAKCALTGNCTSDFSNWYLGLFQLVYVASPRPAKCMYAGCNMYIRLPQPMKCCQVTRFSHAPCCF